MDNDNNNNPYITKVSLYFLTLILYNKVWLWVYVRIGVCVCVLSMHPFSGCQRAHGWTRFMGRRIARGSLSPMSFLSIYNIWMDIISSVVSSFLSPLCFPPSTFILLVDMLVWESKTVLHFPSWIWSIICLRKRSTYEMITAEIKMTRGSKQPIYANKQMMIIGVQSHDHLARR